MTKQNERFDQIITMKNIKKTRNIDNDFSATATTNY